MFAVLAIILVLAVLPVAAALLAYALADAAGCRLNEAEVNPCIILGVDAGGLLASLGILGWLGIATLPIGAAGVLIWLVIALAVFLRSRRNRSTA